MAKQLFCDKVGHALPRDTSPCRWAVLEKGCRIRLLFLCRLCFCGNAFERYTRSFRVKRGVPLSSIRSFPGRSYLHTGKRGSCYPFSVGNVVFRSAGRPILQLWQKTFQKGPSLSLSSFGLIWRMLLPLSPSPRFVERETSFTFRNIGFWKRCF